MIRYVVVDWDREEVLFANSSRQSAERNRAVYLEAHGWSDEDWSGSRVTIEEVDT